MKRHYKKNVFGVLCVMAIFICALQFIIAIIDLVIAPILREFFLDPQIRDWCGLFSRCASQTQETLVEHLTTVEFWKNIDSANIEHRVKNTVILGVIIGCGYVAILFFRRRS